MENSGWKKTMACCVLIVMSMLISPGTIHAGKLDDFEREIKTSPKKTTYTPKTCYYADNEEKGDLGKEMLGECLSGCISSGCFKGLVGEFINAMNEGGTNSLAPDQTTSAEPNAPEFAPPPCPTAGTNTTAQIQTTSMETNASEVSPPPQSMAGTNDPAQTTLVETGTPKVSPPPYWPEEQLIPNPCRLDISYQNVESDIEAIDALIEMRNNPWAIQYRYTAYREREPDDTLDINQLNILYCTTFMAILGIDAGIGIFDVKGNAGYSLTLPIHAHSSKGLGMEFRPVWAEINDNTIEDYTLGFFLSKRYVKLQAGYRWLSANTVSLNGPYAGLSFVF